MPGHCWTIVACGSDLQDVRFQRELYRDQLNIRTLAAGWHRVLVCRCRVIERRIGWVARNGSPARLALVGVHDSEKWRFCREKGKRIVGSSSSNPFVFNQHARTSSLLYCRSQTVNARSP